MTFDKQLKEAKQKKFEARILKDFLLILLGISLLGVAIYRSYKTNNTTAETKKTTTTVEVKKTTQK